MAEASAFQVLWSRVCQEKDCLENRFWPEKFRIIDVKDEFWFERDVNLKGKLNYTLRVCIGMDYPSTLPDLVVCKSPRRMPDWTGGHTTHTFPPKDGLLRICYHRPLCWTGETKICQIFQKGRKWLKAYERHRISGKPMSHYLKEMVPTEEELRRANMI